MENKDQLNQNSESIDQNEKSEAANNAVESNANQPMLNEQEKNHLVELMTGKTFTETKMTKVDEPKEVKPVSEKKAAVAKVKTEPEAATSKKPQEKEAPNAIISEHDKHRIIRLMSSNFNPQVQEGSYDDASINEDKEHLGDLAEQEYDYDKMNKQELVELLEEIVQEQDIRLIKNQVGNIKGAFLHLNKEEKQKLKEVFLAEGGKEEDFKATEDPLEQRFNAAFNIFKHNKHKYTELLEKQKQVNLEEKVKVLEEMKTIINSSEPLKKTYDEFRKLQERWKEIGMVPATELSNLWQNYHFYVDRFFDKVRINKELRDLDMKKNMESKISLCEKTEELILENSVLKSFKLLQKYHDEWRSIGSVPMDKKDDLWERFKTATDKINGRRKEHYKAIQDQQELNYEKKLVFCEKAEELVAELPESIKSWQKKTADITNLLNEWKKTGRAPRQINDEVWVRFKGSLDTFFNAKRDFFAQLKEQQMNNYNLKLALCVEAEKIKDSNEWKKTTNELIHLQKEWKKIGPVPKRHSDKIWKRFRSACDEFFNRKSDYFKDIHKVEAENFKKKTELIEEIKNYKSQNDRANDMEALKSFQRRWVEIGHVPFKEKERLQSEYREHIDKLFDTLSVNRMELTEQNYQKHIEEMMDSSDDNRRLSRERNYLANKMRTLKDEISVWDNNIGFFSSSNKSNKLKEDFEKKIEKAKHELEVIMGKIKAIDKVIQ
ncbi:MAG: hypothetical protein DRJ09_06050 [Bacteroidetes bacterium]|nr:MAG: hypothetical protein DRJ09_06050 [Bacteroidota bacterium]